MFDDKIYKIVEENPSLDYLLKCANEGILVISPNSEKYLNDPNQIPVPGYKDRTISKQFVIDILSHDDTFEKVLKLYTEGLWGVYTIFVDEEGKFLKQWNLDRMNLIDFLKQIDINEVPSIASRYKMLMDYVSYDSFKKSTQNAIYDIVIDGKNYRFPIRLIYSIMDMDKDTYEKFISDEYVIDNIPMSHFLYAVSRYYKDNKIVENYLVDESVEERLKEIRSSEKVDVQMINNYLDADDSLLDKMSVDVELQDTILSGISPDFNDLEKAIYIYIKLCKTLTYDEEYYAINQKGPLSEKHKTIDNIANINLRNNKVVCYEFNAIYAYILHKLGINHKRFVLVGDEEVATSEEFVRYSEAHEFLKFRCGKFLVKADSVTTILQGDIMQAKLNQPLKGLKCENTNEESQRQFAVAMDNVYDYIASREPRISQNKVEEIETFDDIVSQFISVTDKVEPISILDKVDILISKINDSKLVGIDAYSYLLQLKKILFTKKELDENVKISIIRSSNEDSAEALAIISIRIPDEHGIGAVNRYMYRPGSGLVAVSRDQLQEYFDNDTMGYVEEDDPKIPGIR